MLYHEHGERRHFSKEKKYCVWRFRNVSVWIFLSPPELNKTHLDCTRTCVIYCVAFNCRTLSDFLCSIVSVESNRCLSLSRVGCENVSGRQHYWTISLRKVARIRFAVYLKTWWRWRYLCSRRKRGCRFRSSNKVCVFATFAILARIRQENQTR